MSTDHKKVEELYTALKADGAKLPDYNTFSRAVGVDTSFLIEEAKQKKQAKQASPTQPLHPMTTPQDGADGGASSLAVASSAAGSSAPFTPPAQPGSTGGARVEPRAPGNLLFERRWLDKNAPSIVNDDGTTSTHKMAWGEVDGKYVAFPTIIESTKGLRELTPEAAMNLALKSGEYRQFDTKEEASSYADGGYKDLVPQEHKGRLEKQAPSIIGSYYTSLRDEHDAMDEWRGLRESERAGQKNLSPFMSAALDRADRAKRTIDTYKQQEEELREHDLDVSMRSFKDLTKEANVPGVLVADHDKVEQEVQRIMRKNGSDDDVYHDRLVNDLTARINSQQVVEEVEAQAKPKVQALLEEKGKDAYEGFVADKPIKAEAESKLKEREIYYTAQADSARNRLTQQAGAEASDLKQRYEAQAQEIQQAFDMGGMDPEQANAAIEGINEGYKQEVSDLNERAQRTYAQDAARLNRQYLNEQQDIIKTANARIDEALGAYRRNMGERDPELERQITAIYEQEYKKASDKRTGLIAANADLDAMTANSLPAAMVERLGKSFVKNLGGAIRTLGAGEGQGWVYRLGADMENAYLLPQSRAHKFSDLLDPVNFAQLTGELAGGMAPSIAAGGLVAIGTAGAGAPAIATLLTSGMASYATEGLQNSMDVRDQVMRQTGDSNKATDAAYKTFGAHLDTWYLGLLDGLPFAGKVLDAIPSKALRMGASATAEMTTQTLQEVTQDESMGNIIAGRDPWDTGIEGVSALDRILDPERLGEMAVTMAPLTLFGASGQLREGGVQAQASDYARQLVQKKLVAAAIGNARSQWINNLLDQKGEAFATAVVGALHQGGHIDLDAVKGIQGDIGSVVTARGEADRAGLRDDRKGDYVALRTAHMADVAKAAKEGDGPVKTAMLARAKEKEAVIAAMLAGQDADYVSVTFPDGGRYIMGVDEAKAFMAAPNNMTRLVLAQSATQNATFSGHGPKGMILAQKYGEALERFSNNIQQAREWHASRDRQLKDRQQEEIRRIEAKKEAFKREAQRREAEAEQRRSERTQEYRRKQEETARAKEIKDEIIEDYIGSMTMNTADAIDDADGTLVHESGPKPSIAERIRLAQQAMRDLNAKINALRGKYKDEPAAKSVLDLIEEDLFRVQQHRKRLVEQARQQDIEVEGNPKQEAKAELMAQAASELQDAGLMEKVPTTPVSETNETDGTKTEGTNGGAVTSSPPGTTHTDNKGGQNTQQDAEQHNLPPEHGVQGAGTAGATAKDTGAPTGTPVQEQPVPPSQSLKKEPQTEEERTEHERTLDNALLGGDAQRNREAGKRTIAGREYVRQSEKDVPTGSSGSTQFSDKEHVPFDYVLMEADDIQPSHINGTRNPYHFIPEAQPKPRTDKESQVAIQGISAKPNPNLSGASPTAYSGAPIVNARGEVIQGNNRSAGYKGHYAQGGTSYKAALARDAEKFGFTPEQVEGMKKPVLVRRVNVTDARAIELGNYDAKDIESGSKQGIDPAAVSPRIPSGVKSRITGMLFGDDVDATLKEAIRKQYKDVADVLAPYLNPSQRSGLFRKDSHEPSATGVDQIEQLVRHFIFDGGPQDLAGVFEGGIPHHARSGIMAAVPSLFSSPESVGIIREVQQAIMAAAEFRMSGVGTFDSWVSQADAFGPSPAETYSPTELAMAKMFDEARTAKEVRAKLEAYANGTKATEADMFTEAAPGKTRQRSAEDVFGITSQQQDDQGRGDTGVSQEQAGTVPEAARQGVGAAEGGRQRGSVAGTAGKDAAVGKRTKQIEARKTDSGTILEQRAGSTSPVPPTGITHVDKVVRALRDVAPGVKVHTYTDNEAYNRQSQLRGGKSGQHSTAFYDASDDSIHINLNRAKDNTLFHEAAHPVLKAVIAGNPELLNDLYAQLEQHPDFAKYKKFAERYDEGQRKVEAVVEYMADIASGKARKSALPSSLYQKFKAWLNDLLNKLGFRGVKLDPTNLKAFADAFATAVTEGRKIKLRKVEDVVLGKPEDAASEVGTQQSIAITPAMRERVSGEGVPLMQAFAKNYGITVEEAKRQYAEVVSRYTNPDGTKKPGWMKAPNGKPTKLNEQQWVQTRTEAFKNWFGDWEGDPENASKVVDENGEPMVVYHGSQAYILNNDYEQAYIDLHRAIRPNEEPFNAGVSDYGSADYDRFWRFVNFYNAIKYKLSDETKAKISQTLRNRLAVGLKKQFEVFDKSRAGSNTGAFDANLGFFFTADKEFAQRFTYKVERDSLTGVEREYRTGLPHIKEVFLRIDKPVNLSKPTKVEVEQWVRDGLFPSSWGDPKEQYLDVRSHEGSKDYQKFLGQRQEVLQSKGYDGVRNKVKFNGRVREEIIVFDPNQIKSATANTGQFDTANPNINQQLMGSVRFNRMALAQLVNALGSDVGIKERLGRGVLGHYRSMSKDIELSQWLFVDPEKAEQTLAHEIGHLIDLGIPASGAKNPLFDRFAPLSSMRAAIAASSAEVLAAAKALSADWRGEFLPSDRYRNRSDELFADVLSAILVNPLWVESKHPVIAQLFKSLLDSKPDFKAAYDAMRDRILSDTTIDQWQSDVREAQVKSVEDIAGKAGSQKRLSFIDTMKGLFVGRFFRLRSIEGKEIRSDMGRSLRDELELSGGFASRENSEFENEWRKRVVPRLKEIASTPEEASALLHEYMLANRIIHETRWSAEWIRNHSTDARELLMELVAAMPELAPFKDVVDGAPNADLYDVAGRMIGSLHFLGNKHKVEEALDRAQRVMQAVADKYGFDVKGRNIMLAFNIREKLANPGGMDAEQAQEFLDDLHTKLSGDGRYDALERAAIAISNILFEFTEKAYKEGLISPVTWKEIVLPNKDNYAPFAVLENWDDYVEPGMEMQVGTFKNLANIPLASQLKVANLNAWRQAQYRAATLRRAYENAGGPVTVTPLPSGESLATIRRKHREDDSSRIMLMQDGKPMLMTLGNDPGKTFEAAMESETQFRMLGWAADAGQAIRSAMLLFTSWNPSWWYRNIIRGWRTTANRMGLGDTTKNTLMPSTQAEAMAMAKNYVMAGRGGVMSDKVLALVKAGILMPPRQSPGRMLTQDSRRIAMNNGLLMAYDLKLAEREGSWWDKNRKYFVAPKVLDAMNYAAEHYEAYEKAINYLVASQKYGAAKAQAIARRSGIPLVGVGGSNHTMNLLVESIFTWTRVSVQGMRTLRDFARDPDLKAGYVRRVAMYELMPRIAMAVLGTQLVDLLMGDDDDDKDKGKKRGFVSVYGEAVRRASPYKMAMDNTVPMYFRDPITGRKHTFNEFDDASEVPERYEVVALRLPSSEEGRIFGPLLYNELVSGNKELRKGGMGPLNAMGHWVGEVVLPGENPLLESAGNAWTMIARGKNPENDFTGYPVANELLFDAGWGAGRGDAVAGATLKSMSTLGKGIGKGLAAAGALDERALMEYEKEGVRPLQEKLGAPWVTYDNAAVTRQRQEKRMEDERTRAAARLQLGEDGVAMLKYYEKYKLADMADADKRTQLRWYTARLYNKVMNRGSQSDISLMDQLRAGHAQGSTMSKEAKEGLNNLVGRITALSYATFSSTDRRIDELIEAGALEELKAYDVMEDQEESVPAGR